MARRTTRLNSRELKILKQILLSRDGPFCKIGDHEIPFEKLIIDHKDNNYLNEDLDNLQLACQSCNVKKNPAYRAKKKDVDNVCVRVCAEEDPKPQSAEMARNMKSEPLFRYWLDKEMTKNIRMELEDVVDSGAEFAGVSVDTVRCRYLRKLVSRLGPYKIEVIAGTKILAWKPAFFPFKNEVEKWV